MLGWDARRCTCSMQLSSSYDKLQISSWGDAVLSDVVRR